MSGVELALRIVAGLLLTLANAFFVAAEFALTRLRQLPEEEFREDPRLRRAWEMTERLEIQLTGCQLGITTSSVLLGVVAEPAVTALLEPVLAPLGLGEPAVRVTAVVLAVVVINLVHKIWGEQTPTYLGVERPKTVARYTARPLDLWTRTMYPIIIAGDGLAKATLGLFGIQIERSWTREEAAPGEEPAGERGGDRGELREAVIEALGRGELPADRRREVLRALEIDRIPAADIMVPREDVVSLSTEVDIEEALGTIGRCAHSRFPLVRESLDEPLGIIYVPSLFADLDDLRRGDCELADVATESLTVAADMPVSELIDRFQDVRQELALVQEDGRVVGLVTVTDAFEAIAGELRDPFD